LGSNYPHRLRPGNGLPQATVFPKKDRLRRSHLQDGAAETYVDPMAKVSPFKFLQEVRAETEKVTWPTRRETMITTIMVFLMATACAIFFLIADQIFRLGIGG
jgi:preprotein translocase subunit SecE